VKARREATIEGQAGIDNQDNNENTFTNSNERKVQVKFDLDGNASKWNRVAWHLANAS
jgi:hypothetical protein